MYRVELGGGDFDGKGDAVKVANVASAIAKLLLANGSTNKFQAERDAWPLIFTGVTAGKLHPFNPENLGLCSADNCTDGVVRFDELVAWGQWCKRFEFIDVRGEENFGYYSSRACHHGSVDWDEWRLPYWTPREAACLMVELDPKHYDSVKSSRNLQDRGLADHVDATERMATREQEQKLELLPDKASPFKWLEWAQSKGRMVPDRFHEIARDGTPAAKEAVERGIDSVTPAVISPACVASPAQSPATPAPQADAKIEADKGTAAKTNKRIWGDAMLQALYKESILPGVTHASLGEKHGVSRQRIGTLLNEAKEKFRVGNPTKYSNLLAPTRTNKGHKY